ncbi:MAG TPA: hypothetical protein VF990_16680 [Candidatus Dormibacteraeota bacterium]
MKRVIVCVLSLMLLMGGLAGCSYSNSNGSGSTSSSAKAGY